ncbi:MAG: hypothetical protein IH855_00365 [Bacteroidetes bacterium]|nr:hypothetical protein [Bacteroidota bacterium]
MDSETSAQPPRPAGRTDLVALCQALNTESALYVVVGGMAMIQQGFLRATEDVDLLLEGSAENVARVRRALEILPDKAIREMDPDDLETYTVVRVADEIVVDLMLKTCGLSFEDARDEIEWREVDGVPIPFASASLLVRMKQTGREKDVLDLRFLEEKLRERG